MRITIANGKLYYFVNGDLVGSGSFTKPTADKFYIKSSGTVYLDELRVTTGSLSSTSAYTPSSAPYDTNKVLALPDNLVANTIYVKHTIPIASHRIGGVRPSNPETGYFYIPLHDDSTGGQPQLYDGSNWVNVTAMVYDGSSLKNALGFKFSPVGEAPDVDIDAKPERPEKPGEVVDPEKCAHEWEETDRTGPPGGSGGTAGDGEEDEGFLGWLLRKSGELLGSIGDGVIGLLKAALEKIFDGLIALVDMIMDKLAEVVGALLKIFDEVPKLFDGFLGFLSAVFPFMPPEIMLLLTFGIAAVVFVGIIKAIRR